MPLILSPDKMYIFTLKRQNGAYATHVDEAFFSAGAYIRSAFIQYEHGKIVGDGPYRVGLRAQYWLGICEKALTTSKWMNREIAIGRP